MRIVATAVVEIPYNRDAKIRLRANDARPKCLRARTEFAAT